MKNKFLLLFFSIFFIFGAIYFYLKKTKNDSFIQPLSYGYKNPNAITRAVGDINNFALLDHEGNFRELFRHSDSNAIVIIADTNKCNTFLNYATALTELKLKFLKDKIDFYFINPDENLNRNELIKKSKDLKTTIPVLLDSAQVITKELGLKNSSEAIIINPKGWQIVYRGPIGKGTTNLSNILSTYLSGKKIVQLPESEQRCSINFIPPKDISYKNTISPILIDKCLNCHSENGRFPPYFDSYEKIKNWTAMSKETILTERMPPISFDPLYGDFANDISLTNEEKKTLVAWYNQGAPKTEIEDPIKKFKSYKREKHQKEQRLFFAQMEKPHTIPPGGEIVYKYFQLGGPVPFDMWITGYKPHSTNRRQLHHESLFITSKPLSFYEDLARKKFKGIDEKVKNNTEGDIKTYIVGTISQYENDVDPDKYIKIQMWGAGKKDIIRYPKGTGLYIPKGYYLIVETHYMGTGKTETEQTSINFFGAKEKPAGMKIIHSLGLGTKEIEIPPHAKNFEVKTRLWSPRKDMKIISFLGHLHMRGKSVKMELTNAQGEKRTIISIPNFYYGWQTGASLKPEVPILVKSSDKVQAICYFDNSAQNPYNPDPNKKVHFGQRVDRTEMCKMNFNYIYNE